MITGNLPSTLGKLTTISTILLSNNRFVGQIPSSFGNFKELYTLNLSSNQLTGMLPPQLGYATLIYQEIKSRESCLQQWETSNMIYLEYLNLSNNKLYSTIPTVFKNLSQLHTLDLHSNFFYGTLQILFSKTGSYISIDVSPL